MAAKAVGNWLKYEVRRAFDFDGRSSLRGFLSQTALAFVMAGIAAVNLSSPTTYDADVHTAVLMPLYFAFGTLLSIMLIAAMVRRLHDTFRRGTWLYLLPLVAVLGSGVVLGLHWGDIQAIVAENGSWLTRVVIEQVAQVAQTSTERYVLWPMIGVSGLLIFLLVHPARDYKRGIPNVYGNPTRY